MYMWKLVVLCLALRGGQKIPNSSQCKDGTGLASRGVDEGAEISLAKSTKLFPLGEVH